MAKKINSRKNMLGTLVHYDESGHKVGSSRRSFWGGVNHYDASGKKIGESRRGLFGGVKNYDASGKKIGESRRSLLGGTNHYDAKGKKIGETRRAFWYDKKTTVDDNRDIIFGGLLEEERKNEQDQWRKERDDGWEYGVNPEDYKTEEEYDDALEEAVYEWRETCEDGTEYGIDPEDYETEEEYEAALNEAKYEWREGCADGAEYGIDPDSYETEEEYEEALEEARYEWREDCEDGSEYNIDPEDYETEEEYEEALNEAKYAWRQNYTDIDPSYPDPDWYETEDEFKEALSTFLCGEDTSEEEDDDSTAPKREDYPNERLYEAADLLDSIESGYVAYADPEERPKDAERCRFILENQHILAAKYMTHDGCILCGQALKENMSLPVAIEEEDLYPVNSLCSIFEETAKIDTALALKAWHWCVDLFSPYLKYVKDRAPLRQDMLEELICYPEELCLEIAKYMAANPEFCKFIVGESPKGAHEVYWVATAALRAGEYEAGSAVFNMALRNPHMGPKEIVLLTEGMIGGCCEEDEVETIEFFKEHLFPEISKRKTEEIRKQIFDLELEMARFIEQTVRYSDRYAWTRHYAWRSQYRDRMTYALDPLDYDSEKEYLAALNEQE